VGDAHWRLDRRRLPHLGEYVSRSIGQQIYIENRGGAIGNIGSGTAQWACTHEMAPLALAADRDRCGDPWKHASLP
jgi:hypothetical protein